MRCYGSGTFNNACSKKRCRALLENRGGSTTSEEHGWANESAIYLRFNESKVQRVRGSTLFIQMWTGHLKKISWRPSPVCTTTSAAIYQFKCKKNICSTRSTHVRKQRYFVFLRLSYSTLVCVFSYTCNVSASPVPCSWTVPVSILKSWSRSKSTIDRAHRTSPDQQYTGPVNPCRWLQGEIKLNTEYLERWIPKSVLTNVCMTRLLSVVKSKMVQEGVTDRE